MLLYKGGWGGGGGVTRNGGIRDWAEFGSGIRDMGSPAGAGFGRFSRRETGFLAIGGIGIYTLLIFFSGIEIMKLMNPSDPSTPLYLLL